MTDESQGTDLKQELRFLRQRLYWLGWTWDDYKTLFSEEENVELLERTVGSLASVVRNALLDGIQLDIRALSEADRTGSRGSNKNLSLYRLIHWGNNKGCDPARLGEIMAKLEKAQQESDRLKMRRDKLIAHYDLPTILSEDPRLLDWPTEQEIATSIALLVEAMNAGESLLAECVYDYEPSKDPFRRGASSLLDVLRRHGVMSTAFPAVSIQT